MIHFASKCFQAAYASGRMLVLDEDFFGLKSHFRPLSDSCPFQDLLTETKLQWPYNMTDKSKYIHTYQFVLTIKIKVKIRLNVKKL